MRESNNSLKIFFISIPTSPHLSSHVYLKTAEDRSLEQRYSTFRQTTIAQVTQTRKNQTTKESVNRCWIVYSIAITIISRDHQSSDGPLSETASHASSSQQGGHTSAAKIRKWRALHSIDTSDGQWWLFSHNLTISVFWWRRKDLVGTKCEPAKVVVTA